MFYRNFGKASVSNFNRRRKFENRRDFFLNSLK